MLRLALSLLILCLACAPGLKAEDSEPSPMDRAEALGRQLADPAGAVRAAARVELLALLRHGDAEALLDRALTALVQTLRAQQPSQQEAEPTPAPQEDTPGLAPTTPHPPLTAEAGTPALLLRLYDVGALATGRDGTLGRAQEWIAELSGATEVVQQGTVFVVTATEAGHQRLVKGIRARTQAPDVAAGAAAHPPVAPPAGPQPPEPRTQEARESGAAQELAATPPSAQAAPSAAQASALTLRVSLARIPTAGIAAGRLHPDEPLERALGNGRAGPLVVLAPEEMTEQTLRIQQLAGARIVVLAEALALSPTQQQLHLGPEIPYRRDITPSKGDGYRVTTAALPSGWRIDRASSAGLRQAGTSMELDLLVEYARVRIPPTTQSARIQEGPVLDWPEVELARRLVMWPIPAAGAGALLDVSRLLDEPGLRAVLLLEAHLPSREPASATPPKQQAERR